MPVTRIRLSKPIAIVALAALGCGTALADVPTVQITEPSGQIFLSPADFPYSVTVQALLTHDQLSNLNVLDVLVNDASILGGGTPIGSPFGNDDLCSNNVTSNAAVTSCSTYLDDFSLAQNQGKVGVNWNIPTFGNYTLVVSVKHQSAIGTDEESVEVLSLSVEYPAPPAVANAYIKANPGVLASKKQHGCVISQIAEEHAKLETFGPKGGPYDSALIKDYVDAFAASCPLK